MAGDGEHGGAHPNGGWRRLWRRGHRVEDLDPARTDLQVVAGSFDDAEASSSALDRGASGDPPWTAQAQVVLRHHLLLPAGQVEDAVTVAGQDGYRLAEGPTPTTAARSGAVAEAVARAPDVPDGRVVVLQRVQVLDALHCSQERSRMAGLAQRRDGVALGWEALQPPASG